MGGRLHHRLKGTSKCVYVWGVIMSLTKTQETDVTYRRDRNAGAGRGYTLDRNAVKRGATHAVRDERYLSTASRAPIRT